MNVALVEPIKKGGPYTKKEQEERRIQVCHLNFEEGKSATEIAKLLNVNRNTINADIKFWYSRIAYDVTYRGLTAKMNKQIQRMELQRDRLFDELEDAEDQDARMNIEKFMADLDYKLAQLFLKMHSSGMVRLGPITIPKENEDKIKKDKITEDNRKENEDKIKEDKITEDNRKENEIKEFLRDLVLTNDEPDTHDIYSEKELKYIFIKRTKCDTEYADGVLHKMEWDGLIYCKQSRPKSDIPYLRTPDHSETYNIGNYTTLRGYITDEERFSILKKRDKIRMEWDRQTAAAEEKFFKKHGSDKSKWSKDIQEMHDNLEYLL